MKTVVFGGHGFVGNALAVELEMQGQKVLRVGRQDFDFCNRAAFIEFDQLVKSEDKVVLAAAKAPAKNFEDFVQNVLIIENLARYLTKARPQYILNISSDAVYSDSSEHLVEDSFKAPHNPHGLMHCFREALLNQSFSSNIGHLRPTLIYGSDDPHEGYGPNLFLRLAREKQDLRIFGNGEELRDHIHVGDVATIGAAMLNQKYVGDLNAVTSTLISFKQIADMVVKYSKEEINIVKQERSAPMPHGGYRPFDNKKLVDFLPETSFKTLEEFIIETLS